MSEKPRFSFNQESGPVSETSLSAEERQQLEQELETLVNSALYQNVKKLVETGWRDFTPEERRVLEQRDEMRVKLGLPKEE